MPPKRRTTKRKAAAQPVVEPEVEQNEPEVTTEPTVEETNTEETVTEENVDEEAGDDENDEENDGEDEEPNKEKKKKEPLTLEEKIAELDKLSKAHPVGLLRNLAKLQNHYKPFFTTTQNKKPEDHPEGEAFEQTMALIARYGNLKVDIKKINGNNFKFARKVGSDIILKHLYGEDHETEKETQDVMNADGNVEYSTDEEWWTEAKEKHEKYTTARIDKIVARINSSEKMDEEKKKERIERVEKWRIMNEELLSYDEIYKIFDHPYYKVLNNALYLNKQLKYETKLYKYEGDNEIEIAIPKRGGNKRKTDSDEADTDKPTQSSIIAEEENSAEEKLTKFKVCIKVLKNNECILELEHVDDTTKLREAKSEASYKVLEKLLNDDILPVVNRRHLRSQDRDNRRGGRFGNRNNQRNGRNNRGGNQRGGRQNNNRKGNQNNNKGNNKTGGNRNQNNQQNIMRSQPQQQMMGNPGMMGGQQMMMMPVMMGPNGQMMIAQNAQPMMMSMPQQMNAMSMNSPAQQTKPNRGKSRNRGNRGGAKRIKKE